MKTLNTLSRYLVWATVFSGGVWAQDKKNDVLELQTTIVPAFQINNLVEAELLKPKADGHSVITPGKPGATVKDRKLRVHVFFVSAREAALGTRGQQPKVHKIFETPNVSILPEDRTLKIPETKIEYDGARVPNYVLILITDESQTEVFIKNSDGDFPEDPRVNVADPKKRADAWAALPKENFKTERFYFTSLARLQQLERDQTNPDTKKKPEWVSVDVAKELKK